MILFCRRDAFKYYKVVNVVNCEDWLWFALFFSKQLLHFLLHNMYLMSLAVVFQDKPLFRPCWPHTLLLLFRDFTPLRLIYLLSHSCLGMLVSTKVDFIQCLNSDVIWNRTDILPGIPLFSILVCCFLYIDGLSQWFKYLRYEETPKVRLFRIKWFGQKAF